MLVLSRKEGEKVELINDSKEDLLIPAGMVIGTIVLAEVKTLNRARLGFDFPKDIRIKRAELKAQEEKEGETIIVHAGPEVTDSNSPTAEQE